MIFHERRVMRTTGGEFGVGVACTRIRLWLRGLCGRDEGQLRRADGAACWASRFIGLVRFLGATLILAAPIASAQGAHSVTLAWEPSSEGEIVNYNIYYGVACRNYTDSVSAGTATKATISGLMEGTTYYFAVTASNSMGLESDFSDEISYTVQKPFPRLQIRVTPTRQVVLTVTGQPDHAYEILATETWTTWTVIGTVLTGASGSAVFTGTNAANSEVCHYRTRDAL
jgi:hypothetical protein